MHWFQRFQPCVTAVPPAVSVAPANTPRDCAQAHCGRVRSKAYSIGSDVNPILAVSSAMHQVPGNISLRFVMVDGRWAHQRELACAQCATISLFGRWAHRHAHEHAPACARNSRNDSATGRLVALSLDTTLVDTQSLDTRRFGLSFDDSVDEGVVCRTWCDH